MSTVTAAVLVFVGGGGDGSSGNGSACYASTRTRGISRIPKDPKYLERGY